MIRVRKLGFGELKIRPGRGIRAIHFSPVEKWRGMTMLKVPKVGMQIDGGEWQGVLLFRREATVQRAWREMVARKSSTR